MRRLTLAVLPLVVFGCGPTSAPSGATPGNSNPLQTAKKSDKPTVDELKASLKSLTVKEAQEKYGKPVFYMAENNVYAIGFAGVTVDKDGKPDDITIFGFTEKGELYTDDKGVPGVVAMKKSDPIPEGKQVSRDDMKKAILGRPPEEVKRVLGSPEETSDFGSTQVWKYKPRTLDTNSNKPDTTFIVNFADGFCSRLTMTN